MNPHLLIAFIGVFYILIFGGLSIIRREGLSIQFAFEVTGLTLLVVVGTLLTGITLNPILFLIFIYLVTMRARLLVDLANLLSARGRQRDAMYVLQLALRLFPDRTTRLIVLMNMGIVQIHRQNPGSAQHLLEDVLKEAKDGGLGIKYEAACHYNLGLALQRRGKETQSVQHFKKAIEAFPSSIYSQAAEHTLKRQRSKSQKAVKESQNGE